jgi:hypothetical protein
VTDPDRTLWELYTFHEDIDHRGEGQTLEQMIPEAANRPVADGARGSAPVVLEHQMGTAVRSFPGADGSVDEVRLRGSFNWNLDAPSKELLVNEAFRVLRPGGRVFAHTLVGEQSSTNPELPGPAAAVQFVPPEAEVVGLLEAAGFQNLNLIKFDASPCFVRGGVAMREQQLEGFKPASSSGRFSAIYKGPFRQIVDDAGSTFPRGVRVAVDATQAELLRRGEWASQFLVVDGADSPG